MEQQEDKGQAMYDTVALAARKIIYGEGEDDTRFKMVLQRLAGGKAELGQTIGSIAGAVVGSIAMSAQQKGREIPQDILIEATDETVDSVLEIAEAGKLIEGDSAQLKQEALKVALKTVGEAELQTMTPEKKQRAAASLEELKGKSGIIGERRA